MKWPLQRSGSDAPPSSISKPRVHVQLPHGLDARRYAERYNRGIEPDVSPYGFHLAEQEGFEISFSRDRGGSLGRWMSRVSIRLGGFDFPHALANRHLLYRADIIWTMIESDWMGIAVLSKFSRRYRKPIIGNCVWLFNRWPDLSTWHRALYRYLSREISLVTVHSEGCLPVAEVALPSVDVKVMHFGIAADTFAPAEPEDQVPSSGVFIIFAAGNDKTRDWETLIKAFGNDCRFRVIIVCGWLDENLTRRYNNLTITKSPTREEFRTLYREADVVAIPMHPNIFSGITVALEAAASAKPILATRTGGVPTYLREDEAIFVQPDDPAAMRNALLSIDAEELAARGRRGQRAFVTRDYSTRGMIRRYASETASLLDRSHAIHFFDSKDPL
jgi:glycosyltransferase involved in cell wall biosynthesis